MISEVKNHVTVKIFIGYQLAIDFKMQLNQRSEWKQASVINEHAEMPLKIVYHNDVEHIGKYSEATLLSLQNIKDCANDVKKTLAEYVPGYDFDTLKFSLFPQVFVS